jgi:hypothetical protein
LSAYLWRMQTQRAHQYAKAWALDLQKEAKRSRAEAATASYNRLPDKFRAGFEVGQQVWLYMAEVKPGWSRKLARAWHGPFRIVDNDEGFRVKLDAVGTPYRVAPWVHVARLKPRIVYEDRPSQAEPVEVLEGDDWDASILPEDSWEPDEAGGQYKIEDILDVRWTHPRTRNGRRAREYLVWWAGCEELERIPTGHVASGRLFYEFEASAKAKGRFAAMQSGDAEEETTSA